MRFRNAIGIPAVPRPGHRAILLSVAAAHRIIRYMGKLWEIQNRR